MATSSEKCNPIGTATFAVGVSCSCQILRVVVKSFQIPERWYRYKYDIYGCSHQIPHFVGYLYWLDTYAGFAQCAQSSACATKSMPLDVALQIGLEWDRLQHLACDWRLHVALEMGSGVFDEMLER